MYAVYNILWTIAYALLLPCIFFGKKEYFSRKFAVGLPERKGDKTIWIHALSVGEVLSTRPLIKALKEKYPEKSIILTVKTTQGMKVAKKEFEAEVEDILFMPLDYSGAIKRIVKAVNPCLLLLVETDIWPGLIFGLKKRGIKIILVNGRVSPKTFKGYKQLKFYFKKILSDMEYLLMQSDLDRGRMIKTGVPEEKIKTAGNIKFDQAWMPMDEAERKKWRELLGISNETEIIVAGSTHEGEEEPVLKAFKKLAEKHSDLMLIIAPRKLDRTEAIETIGNSLGLKMMKRSGINADIEKKYNVLILDTIGELGRVYGLAAISFVGGSFAPIGGHNLLEPASFGCPVLFGPHMHNFVLMSELLLEHNGGIKVEDSDGFYFEMEKLLADRNRLKQMGENAKNFVEANSGAVNRVIDTAGGCIV